MQNYPCYEKLWQERYNAAENYGANSINISPFEIWNEMKEEMKTTMIYEILLRLLPNEKTKNVFSRKGNLDASVKDKINFKPSKLPNLEWSDFRRYHSW